MVRRYHGAERRRRFYRANHFTAGEANQLKSLRRLDYFEIRIMVRQRRNMWLRFNDKAEDRGWGRWRRNKEWLKTVADFYTANDFITKVEASRARKIGGWMFTDTINWHDVWFYFDYVRSTLPVERQYGRTHRAAKYITRRERQAKAVREAEQARNESWINGLMRTVGRQPERDAELTGQAQRLGFRGKNLLRAAMARGYGR